MYKVEPKYAHVCPSCESKSLTATLCKSCGESMRIVGGEILRKTHDAPDLKKGF